MANFGNLETDVEPLAGLMREHIEIDDLITATAEVLVAAIDAPDDPTAAVTAIEQVRDLDAYLWEDFVVHIAKEEDVLFPALRGLADDIDVVVDDMIEQHDRVRDRREVLERALATMAESHEEVDAGRTAVRDGLRAAGGASATPEVLRALLDAVRQLSWILQGHFGDEEDDLFEPALALLPEDRWAELAAASTALEAAGAGA